MQFAALLVLASHLLAVRAAVGVDCSRGVCAEVNQRCREQHEGEKDRCFHSVSEAVSSDFFLPENLCSGYCSLTSDESKATHLDTVNMNITVEMFAQSPSGYGLHISWYIPDNVPDPSDGFEVRVSREYQSTRPCYQECIDDPAAREVTIDKSLEYMNDSKPWTIQVVSLPFYSHRSARTTTYQVPKTCQEISVHDPLHCGPPMYSPVPELNITTTVGAEPGTMDAHLSWKPSRPAVRARSITYPTNVDYSVYPDAHIYYIEISNSIFLVQNTTEAIITGLNRTEEHKVQIQSYENCSGLDSVLKFPMTEGCSDYAVKTFRFRVSSALPVPSPTSSAIVSPTDTSGVPSSTPSPTEPEADNTETVTNHLVTVSVAIVTILVLCVLGIIAFVFIYIKRRSQERRTKTSLSDIPSTYIGDDTALELFTTLEEPIAVQYQNVAPSPRKNPKLLLIYSLDSPEKEIEAVLHHLVGELSQYGIEVEYPEKCNENISRWVEQQILQADKVLCVCNEAFLREFHENGSNGITFVSALRTMAYSYQNEIPQRYGLVLPKQSYKRFVPSGYLKGAFEFLLDPKTVTERVARFVKGLPPHPS